MIKRKLYDDIKTHLSKKEISLIVGARQAGKTTLMLHLQSELKKRGERTLFLNLDIEEDKYFFTSQLQLLSKIELELGQNKGFVFIDEIQRKENAGIFLKGLYDRNLPYKFIVSGSGSLELKEKIHESLAGRKRIFNLGTLSFEEYINYKTGYRYENKLDTFLELEKEKSRLYLQQYLNFGGYPRVVLEDELNEKRLIIDEIYQSYINRDISAFLKVAKLDSYSQLIRILSDQTGNIVNHTELANTLNLSLPTIHNYLWYAEKTYIIQKLTPFFSNKRKEITKSPVYYFIDPGLRNYLNGVFGLLRLPADFSFPFENLILNTIKENIRSSGANVYFWRSKDGAEVDFLIDYRTHQIPVEVKYRSLEKPELTRSFLSFIKQYSPQNAVMVNLTLHAGKKVNNTNIHIVPFYRLSEIINCE